MYQNQTGEIPNVLFLLRRTSYGREFFYPNCDMSKCLAALAGTATLTPEKMRLLVRMGFNFDISTDLAHAERMKEVYSLNGKKGASTRHSNGSYTVDSEARVLQERISAIRQSSIGKPYTSIYDMKPLEGEAATNPFYVGDKMAREAEAAKAKAEHAHFMATTDFKALEQKLIERDASIGIKPNYIKKKTDINDLV